MRKVLLIDDAPDVHQLVEATLGNAFRVVWAQTLAEGWSAVQAGEFELILLDIVLPDGDGYKFCAKLQGFARTASTPLIFLTGKGDVTDRVLGFSIGADDYIVKPFEPIELRARVEARIRKSQQKNEHAESISKDGLRIDIATQRAFVSDKNAGESGPENEVDLTPVEFKLLVCFARHEDHVLSREQLLATVWSENVNVTDRSVDVHVSNLRKKIAASAYTIKPVYGVGYRFLQREKKAAAA